MVPSNVLHLIFRLGRSGGWGGITRDVSITVCLCLPDTELKLEETCQGCSAPYLSGSPGAPPPCWQGGSPAPLVGGCPGAATGQRGKTPVPPGHQQVLAESWLKRQGTAAPREPLVAGMHAIARVIIRHRQGPCECQGYHQTYRAPVSARVITSHRQGPCDYQGYHQS